MERDFTGERLGDGVTRKQLLGRAAAGGLVLSAGGFLAACGGGNSSSSSSSGAPVSGKPKPGGVLRAGMNQGSPSDTLDPHGLVVYPDWARAFALYDLLTYPNAETFKIENRLADEFSPNAKGDVWTVRLKDGVEFHDGKTLGADDLIFSVKRMIKNGFLVKPTLSFVDPNGMTKVDARTVRFKFKRPYAEFAEAMAASNEFIVPVGFDPKKPIGTGPFKLKEFKPGDRTVFDRFENYWGDGPYVDQLVLVSLPDDSARTNALLSGQVDAIQNLPLQQLASVKSNPNLKVLNAQTGNWSPFSMNCQAKPFTDVRVRQAMRLIVNRQQLIEQALLGNGRVANDLYTPYDPAYASDIPQRETDIEQAKSLLKQAGQENLTIELQTSQANVGINEGSQVFAQQAKEAGVTIKVRVIDPSTYYGDEFLTRTFGIDTIPTYPSYLCTLAIQDGPNAPLNAVHFHDDEFTKLLGEAEGTMDAAKRGEILKQMQGIQHERGGYIIHSFYNQVDAYSSKLEGFVPDRNGWPLTSYGFNRVWFS
jgi:peptide/nickel transport system substrate-binding protein